MRRRRILQNPAELSNRFFRSKFPLPFRYVHYGTSKRPTPLKHRYAHNKGSVTWKVHLAWFKTPQKRGKKRRNPAFFFDLERSSSPKCCFLPHQISRDRTRRREIRRNAGMKYRFDPEKNKTNTTKK